MRKEQGQKLKELMARKRAEKKKNMENELADLQSLQSLREANQNSMFKEEILTRGFQTFEGYQKRIKFLQVKLGIQVEEIKEEEKDKFALLDIADEFLKPDQLKQKRILKMHKTAQKMRDQRKKEQESEKQRIEDLKSKDKEQYVANLYEQRRLLLERLQSRAKQKEEFAKRGSKGAQRRMQMLAELGTDENHERKKRAEQGLPI